MQECFEWFHNSKFDIMMARMTPVSLHFSDVPTGWKKKMEKNLYRQTTVGYWFCMFVTSSLSRRTVLQINLCQLHSVPWHAWFQNKIERYKFERYNDSRSIFLSTAHAFQWKHHICFFRAIHHIDPLHRKQTLTLSQCNSRDLTDSPYRNLEKCKKC